MTELVGKFVSHLNEEGLSTSDYRSSKLKQRLRGAFGKQLDFRKPSDPSQPELVYSANGEKGEIVESLVSQSDMTDGGLESGVEEIDEQDPRARKDIENQVCETFFWTWSQFFHGHQRLTSYNLMLL